MSVIPEDEADVVSEVFAGHPMPLFDDAEMYINPTAEHSDSLTVNEIQSFPDVDSTNPGSMLFRQIKLFASLKVLVQSVQGLASMHTKMHSNQRQSLILHYKPGTQK